MPSHSGLGEPDRLGSLGVAVVGAELVVATDDAGAIVVDPTVALVLAVVVLAVVSAVDVEGSAAGVLREQPANATMQIKTLHIKTMSNLRELQVQVPEVMDAA